MSHGEGNGDGDKGETEEEQLEFFCDRCDETIPSGVERMECVVCPDEFCLCQACYDEGEVIWMFEGCDVLSTVYLSDLFPALQNIIEK